MILLKFSKQKLSMYIHITKRKSNFLYPIHSKSLSHQNKVAICSKRESKLWRNVTGWWEKRFRKRCKFHNNTMEWELSININIYGMDFSNAPWENPWEWASSHNNKMENHCFSFQSLKLFKLPFFLLYFSFFFSLSFMAYRRRVDLFYSLAISIHTVPQFLFSFSKCEYKSHTKDIIWKPYQIVFCLFIFQLLLLLLLVFISLAVFMLTSESI